MKYAPTDNTAKDEYFEKLQIAENNEVVVIENLNSKVGIQNTRLGK